MKDNSILTEIFNKKCKGYQPIELVLPYSNISN